MKAFDKLKQRLDKLTIPLQVLLLIFLLLFIYLSPSIIITIKPGEAGVFWSRFFGGTQVDHVYPEGIHFIFPWDEMVIYNARLRAREHELEVLTNTGLNVQLYLSIRFRPEYRFIALLHQKIGPNYLEVVIIPEVTAVLRETIGTMTSDEIYTTGRKVITIAINEAIEQVAQRYIQVDDVLIKRITLPTLVAESIKFKIQQKHLVEAHKFIVEKAKIEAERKRIEAEGIRDHLETVASAVPEGEILTWRGIQATELLAQSNNTKIVLIGGGHEGLPLILNAESPSPLPYSPKNQHGEPLESMNSTVPKQTQAQEKTMHQNPEKMTVSPSQQLKQPVVSENQTTQTGRVVPITPSSQTP
jgi:regulator of protease activity HflC (stomatin/prohibitin superfamily)